MTPPVPKAVVFDLGGVVVRWSNEPTYRRIAARLGLPFRRVENALESASSALHTGRISGEEFWGRVGRKLDCSIPAEVRNVWAQDFARDARLDPQVLRWIDRLRARGVRIACLSNNIAWHARVLRSRGWLRGFAPALLSNEIGAAKPSRAAYDYARHHIGLPVKNLLLLDDRRANVAAARRAGWTAVHFREVAEARRRVERWLRESSAGRPTGPGAAGRGRVPTGPSRSFGGRPRPR